MAYALHKGKIYKCDGRTKGFDNSSYDIASKIILRAGFSEKIVLNSECRLFTQVFLLAKYQKKWYSLPDEIIVNSGKICLVGEHQEGFKFEYVDAGFPVYSKLIDYPQDISEIVVRVTELKHGHQFITQDYQIPIEKLECNNPNQIQNILEMIYAQEKSV